MGFSLKLKLDRNIHPRRDGVFSPLCREKLPIFDCRKSRAIENLMAGGFPHLYLPHKAIGENLYLQHHFSFNPLFSGLPGIEGFGILRILRMDKDDFSF
jgi:hypothetical protein